MDRFSMRITLVGSRHFGAITLEMMRTHDVEIARVVVADAGDRLALVGGGSKGCGFKNSKSS